MSVIDQYINEQPEDKQPKLKELCKIIRNIVPKETTEKISWGIPTFYLNGNLVHFSSETKHIGFHPGNSGIDKFKDKFEKRKYSKGTIQFPFSESLPKELIEEIVKYRIKENKHEI